MRPPASTQPSLTESSSAELGGATRSEPVRVLYSFPHKIGAERICLTAWQHASAAAAAGAELTVMAGSAARSLGPAVKRTLTTLTLGRHRIPTRLLGRYRALRFHDWKTARWLRAHGSQFDVVHLWPGAAQRTIEAAHAMGLKTVLERPNAHTAYAYEAAREENRIVGIELPKGHDHAFDARMLRLEESEYRATDFLLCPSAFVGRTFLERGTPAGKLLYHRYGYDQTRFCPDPARQSDPNRLVAIYAGVCEPRKGLHYALQAWFESRAYETGQLMICGKFVPGYAERLGDRLQHASVQYLGHRTDLPELMRQSDVFLLSSVEEGSALVTYEARGSGCVLVVSDATGAPCAHQENALVHPCRNTMEFTGHLRQLNTDRSLLHRLRHNSLEHISELSWSKAGEQLLACYKKATSRQH